MAPPPPQQPQWAPPPQQPTGADPATAARQSRPIGVTLAAIFLIVMGVLEALVGGCTVVGGSAVGSLSNGQDNGAFGGLGAFIAGIGIFILVLGILQIVAGAGALGGRNWARWLGIVIAAIFAVFGILGGVASMTSSNGATGGIGSIVIGVLYALTAYGLFAGAAFFAYRR